MNYDKYMAKDNSDEIVVYWGPIFEIYPDTYIDWNIFYQDPIEVLPEFKKQKDKGAKQESLIYCPAFNSNYKNTFMINNVTDSKFVYNNQEGMWEIPNKYQIHPTKSKVRTPYIVNRHPLMLSMAWLFVAEESLEMEMMAPYLHRTEASKYGVIGTGKFDIGKWFRPVHAEYLLWEGVEHMHISEGEPMFYVRFNTDKKVVLKRFVNNEEIFKRTVSIVETKYIFGKFPPLERLYDYFAKTRTKDVMLKAIKESVID